MRGNPVLVMMQNCILQICIN